MNDLFDLIQELLLNNKPDYAGFCSKAQSLQQNMSDKERAYSHIPIRLCLALWDFSEQRAGSSDIAVLLRQCVRAYDQRLEIPHTLWQQFRADENEFGLRKTAERSDGTVEIFADPWCPDWLPDASRIDVLEERRHTTPVVGDGTLYAMTETKWSTYQTEAQKAAVSAFLFASPGSTLLVNLPTGGGKSLCVLLPAWLESHGGRIQGGTTLVIVPTVSLALDQKAQSSKFFSQCINEAFSPQCQTSDTSKEERHTIRQGIRDGTLPVLYLAPEALLNSELYQVCLEAAAAGTLTRLVIDEAHLVETWGANFRTEFQLLATYRKKLMDVSSGHLRTLLLSATTSSHCVHLLQQLFSEDDHFSIIQSNQLRPEISYWFSTSRSLAEREKRVREALRYLPRPLILYVTRPDDAKQWFKLLHRDGFKRMATFTGKTKAQERRRLMHDWNNNSFDVMIATSAFGLGVDKSNIRTIVHACLPENTDRFYQEVGRAGRDGFSAISLMCMALDDTDATFRMQSGERITVEKALERWQGMRQQAILDTNRGNVLLVNMNATPRNKPDMHQGERNQEWNWHTILLMQRAGMLELKDPRSALHLQQSQQADTDDTCDTDEEMLSTRLEIELLASHMDDDQEFVTAITDIIEQEKQDIQKSTRDLSNLVKHQSKDRTSRCIAYDFASLYPDTALACGGCPFCRHQGQNPYTDHEKLIIDMEPMTLRESYTINSDIQRRLGSHGMLHILWDGLKDSRSLTDLAPVLTDLAAVGFRQFILPSTIMLDTTWVINVIKRLAEKHATIPHILFPDTWVIDRSTLPIYAIPTVVVYPSDDNHADCLYRTLQQRLPTEVPRVNIITPSLYLASQYGYFKDRVNGLSESMASFSALLESTNEEELF